MRVLLVGSSYFVDESLSGLRNQPHIRVVGSTADPLEARGMAEELGPNVVVVDEEVDQALTVIGQIARKAPGAMVFLAVDRPNLDLLRKVASHGGRGILRKPLDGFELAREVEQAQAMFQSRVQQWGGGDDLDEEERPVSRMGAGFMRQEVVAVHSPKGGVGKTTVALNLAAAYLAAGGRGTRVLLVDFDPYGNLVGTIPLEGTATVADWVGLSGVPSRTELESLVCVHKPTGIRVIPSPRSMADADAVDAKTAEHILAAGRQHFDVVVVDCGLKVLDPQVVAFDQATRILEIAIAEVPTLRALNELRDFLEALGVDQAKIRTVLNRIPRRPDLPIREVAEMLPWPLVAKIPEDPAISLAINRGEILVLTRPDSPAAAEMRKLAGATATVRHTGERRPGLLSRLFKRR